MKDLNECSQILENYPILTYEEKVELLELRVYNQKIAFFRKKQNALEFLDIDKNILFIAPINRLKFNVPFYISYDIKEFTKGVLTRDNHDRLYAACSLLDNKLKVAMKAPEELIFSDGSTLNIPKNSFLGINDGEFYNVWDLLDLWTEEF